MKTTTNETSQWWEQQSKQRRIFNRLLLSAMLEGCISAHWQQCEGRFTAVPGEDYQRKITHGLGHKRYNIVVRELGNQGLTPGEDYPLSIRTSDFAVEVTIALENEAYGDQSEMTLKWDQVEDPDTRTSISELIESFPADRDYRMIRGRVVDHNNQPVPKAKIVTEQILYRYLCTSPAGRDPMSYSVLSDAEGKFELRLIHNEEHWRQEEIALIIASEKLKARRLVLEEPVDAEDINNVEIQLPQPVELVVNFDMPVDDVIAPLKIYIESPETRYWETRVIQKSGTVSFPYLAPAKYVVSIHQMNNDFARQVVDLTSGKNQTLNFESTQKAELLCEVTCARRPSEEASLEFKISSEQHSPFENYRESKDENFEHERIELSPDLFEQTEDGRWKSAFPIKNIIGGLYEVGIQYCLPITKGASGWEQWSSREKSKTILVNGETPVCGTVDLEFRVNDEQTIWFRLRQA